VEASNKAPSRYVIWLRGERKRTNGNVSYEGKGPALLKLPPGPSIENDWVVFWPNTNRMMHLKGHSKVQWIKSMLF